MGYLKAVVRVRVRKVGCVRVEALGGESVRVRVRV